MNKLVIPIFATALAGFLGAPAPAHAGHGNETAAAIGGFIGGVIVGSHLGDRHEHTTVIVERDHRHHRHAPRGYWRYDTVRVWTPGRWIVSYDDCGRRTRYFAPGRYEYRRERVWVAVPDHRRDRDGWRR